MSSSRERAKLNRASPAKRRRRNYLNGPTAGRPGTHMPRGPSLNPFAIVRARRIRLKAARLKAAFDSAPESIDLPPGIGLSVGWTEVPRGAKDLKPLVRQADEGMYHDKGTR